MVHKVGVRLGRNAPGFQQPWLNLVFLSVCRTVLSETLGSFPSMTNWSVNSCKVQRLRPFGGSLHASSMRACSMAPWTFTFCGRAGLGRGAKAASKLSSTNRWRTRWMVEAPTPKACAMSASARAGPSGLASANRRSRACVSLRAAALPEETKCRSKERSSLVSVTMYFSTAAPPCLTLKTVLRNRRAEAV